MIAISIRKCPRCGCKKIDFDVQPINKKDPKYIHAYDNREYHVSCVYCKLKCPTIFNNLLDAEEMWNEFCLDYKFDELRNKLKELEDKLDGS